MNESSCGYDYHRNLTSEIDLKKQERKESERQRKTYEIKDPNGNILCKGIIVTQAIESESPFINEFPKKTGRLIEFILEKDGKSIDILSLVAIKDPLPIYMTDSLMDEDGDFYFFINNVEDSYTLIPPPDSGLSLAIALHELGHSKQKTEDFFIEVKKVDEIGGPYPAPLLLENIEGLYDSYKTLFPAIYEQKPSETELKNLKTLQQDYNTLSRDVSELEEKDAELDRKMYKNFNDAELKEDIKKRRKEIKQHLDSLRQKLIELTRRIRTLIDELTEPLRATNKYAERDATKKAFKWLKQIKKSIGLDIQLSAPVEIDTTELNTDLSCSPRDIMIQFLASYEATGKGLIPPRKK